MYPTPTPGPAADELATFWALPAAEVLARLRTTATGLSTEAAAASRALAGPNRLKAKEKRRT